MPTARRELIYRCSFCRKRKSWKLRVVERHEPFCNANPDRKPFPGELTSTFQTGTWTFGDHEDDGFWTPHETMPKWWPGAAGLIWTGARWVPVVGWATERDPSPAGDSWPTFDGKPLDKHPPIDRLYLLNLDERPRLSPDEEVY